MAFDFPASPTVGTSHTPAGGPTYTWNGYAWVQTSSNTQTSWRMIARFKPTVNVSSFTFDIPTDVMLVRGEFGVLPVGAASNLFLFTSSNGGVSLDSTNQYSISYDLLNSATPTIVSNTLAANAIIAWAANTNIYCTGRFTLSPGDVGFAGGVESTSISTNDTPITQRFDAVTRFMTTGRKNFINISFLGQIKVGSYIIIEGAS